MKKHQFWNKLLAWLVFAIASFTYLSTLEPSVSFWDCGEFIASADKLMIGHPPGAPLFMIVARCFAMLAPSPDKVPLFINAMSALCSSFTILFLFWTITHLSRKLVMADAELTSGQSILILGCGLVGSLAYTFTDTFWFSAVEGEVYAMSSLFTAVVFWAILRWEDEADNAHSLRWLILIGLLLGLSIGVHLLNLLAIPAMALVYYYKKVDKESLKGIIITLLVSVVILGGIMYVIIPGTVKGAALVDLLFVNVFHLPFNTGVLAFFISLMCGLIYFIRRSYMKHQVLLNTVLTFCLVLFIGYSSFAIVLIRANVQPTMNQSSPDDAFSLLSYLNREQYGQRPLFYGNYYNAPVIGSETTGDIREQVGDEYKVVGAKQQRLYDANFQTFFPRMWSNQAHHVAAYKQWGKVKGTPVKTAKGEVLNKPSFSENLRYLVRYQLGHMYFRYFMWNFVGRQNDQQGHGDVFKGNWISGIPFVDSELIGGNQDKLPDMVKNDKARNTYFFLPLLLGLAGIAFQLKRRKTKGSQSFLLVTTLFVLTGVAIVIYLNQNPYQPRERDYAYAASFYAFSIWIGMGVMLLSQVFAKMLGHKYAALVSTLCCLSVPSVLLVENWDDHDRSDRYIARDFAWNYLNSCEPNAILFTSGDNETFPLWYLQEVEGVRTDVRVCNLNYLTAGWYVDQMRKQAYESAPLPFSLDDTQTRTGKNDYVYLVDYKRGEVSLDTALAWLQSDNPRTKMLNQHYIEHLPSKVFNLKVNKADVLANETLGLDEKDDVIEELNIDYSSKSGMSKHNLMVLDLLANNHWERPIYFAAGLGPDHMFGLQDYLQMCGMAYQLVPVKSKKAINTAVAYKQVMSDFRLGSMSSEEVYLDGDSRKHASMYRRQFVSLAQTLLSEGQEDKARKVMEKCHEKIASKYLSYQYSPPFQNDLPYVDTLLKVEMAEEALCVIHEMKNNLVQDMDYILSFAEGDKLLVQDKFKVDLTAYYELVKLTGEHLPKLNKVLQKEFETYYVSFGDFMKA